jgi:hypothetical protein
MSREARDISGHETDAAATANVYPSPTMYGNISRLADSK